MSQKAPLSNSVGRASRQPEPASDKSGIFITFLACGIALAGAYLLKNNPQALAITSLVVTTGGITAAFFYSRSKAAPKESAENPVSSLKVAIDSNRNECASRLGELRKAVDAIKSGRSHGADTGAVSDEIAKLRAEVATLRATVSGR